MRTHFCQDLSRDQKSCRFRASPRRRGGAAAAS